MPDARVPQPTIHSSGAAASSLLLRPGRHLRGTVVDVTRGERVTIRSPLLLQQGWQRGAHHEVSLVHGLRRGIRTTYLAGLGPRVR
jgi:hypothetical protein